MNVCTHRSSPSSLDDAQDVDLEVEYTDDDGDLNSSGDVDLGVDGAEDGADDTAVCDSSQNKSYSRYDCH